jgi:hypothetical protein
MLGREQVHPRAPACSARLDRRPPPNARCGDARGELLQCGPRRMLQLRVGGASKRTPRAPAVVRPRRVLRLHVGARASPPARQPVLRGSIDARPLTRGSAMRGASCCSAAHGACCSCVLGRDQAHPRARQLQCGHDACCRLEREQLPPRAPAYSARLDRRPRPTRGSAMRGASCCSAAHDACCSCVLGRDQAHPARASCSAATTHAAAACWGATKPTPRAPAAVRPRRMLRLRVVARASAPGRASLFCEARSTPPPDARFGDARGELLQCGPRRVLQLRVGGASKPTPRARQLQCGHDACCSCVLEREQVRPRAPAAVRPRRVLRLRVVGASKCARARQPILRGSIDAP